MRWNPNTPRLLRHLASDGIDVRIAGDCMSPHFGHGERVRVTKTTVWLPGDILVYFNPRGQLVAHRMLGFYRRNGRWKLLIQADSANRPDMAVLPEQVLGAVTGVRVGLIDRARSVGRYIGFALIGRRGRSTR